MTEREIAKVRKKILWLSTLSFVGVMLLMGGFIYLFSSVTIQNDTKNILRYIAENDGDLFREEKDAKKAQTILPENAPAISGDRVLSEDDRVAWSLEELFGFRDSFGNTDDQIYATRYFAVLYDASKTIESIKTSHIAAIDEEEAEQYAEAALKKGKSFGTFGRFFYHVAQREKGGTIVIYIDRSTQITTIRRILIAALGLLAIGTLLAFFLMRVFSRNYVHSAMDNVEKQKQFLTNASHELKTPLAVIRANTEMQEMLEGETEWTSSNLRQVDRMNGLIQNLVKIARAQEEEGMDIHETDISGAVRETAETFRPVAAGEGKKLETEITSPLIILADESRVRQITSLLVDNAVKYCDPEGTVSVRLVKNGKGALMSVSNHYAEGKDVDYSRFFERFYRQDEARTIGDSSKKNGYGIGLSIAESLVRSMKGSIDVHWKDGVITFTCRFI